MSLIVNRYELSRFYFQLKTKHPSWIFHENKKTLLSKHNVTPTYSCMEGFVQYNKEVVHSGSIYIKPDEIYLFYRALVDSSCPMYLHEVATEVHPTYFDYDQKLELTTENLKLILSVIEDADFDCELYEPILLKYYKNMVPATDFTREKKDFLPFDNSICNTWFEVLELMIETELIEKHPFEWNLIERDYTFVIDVIINFMLIAVGILIQKCAKLFYPNLPSSSEEFYLWILSSQGPDHLKKDDKNRYKFGGHFYLSDLAVNHDYNAWICNYICNYFCNQFKRNELWEEAFDYSQYSTSDSGLRVPFSLKISECSKCKNKINKGKQSCKECGQHGRVAVNKSYQPLMRITPDGEPEPKEHLMKAFFEIPMIVYKSCSVRYIKSLNLTDKFTPIGEKPNLLKKMNPKNEMIDKLNITEKTAAARIDKLAQDFNITDRNSDRFKELVSTVVDHERFTNKRSYKNTCYLDPMDPRYHAVVQFLPNYLGRHLHPVYRNLEIKGIILYKHDKLDYPEKLCVITKGEASKYCFHRMTNAINDDVTEPGEHTSLGMVYFFVDLTSITQKCNNPNIKQTRRIEKGKRNTSCKDWIGKTIPIAIRITDLSTTKEEIEQMQLELRQQVRNMFYLPEQQTQEYEEEMIRRVQNFNNKKRSALLTVGPTEHVKESAKKILRIDEGSRCSSVGE